MTNAEAHDDPAALQSAAQTGTETTADGPAGATRGDKVLLVVFWAWAAVLLVATLSQLFGWEGVLDALDAKRWFAR